MDVQETALKVCKLALPNCEFEEFTYKKLNALEFAAQNAATESANGFAAAAASGSDVVPDANGGAPTKKPTGGSAKKKTEFASETELLDPEQMTEGAMYYFFRVNLTWTNTPEDNSTRKRFYAEGSYNKVRQM